MRRTIITVWVCVLVNDCGRREGIGQGPLISEAEILDKLRKRKPNVYPNQKQTLPPVEPSVPTVVGDPRYEE